jgi:hypothetical protein
MGIASWGLRSYSLPMFYVKSGSSNEQSSEQNQVPVHNLSQLLASRQANKKHKIVLIPNNLKKYQNIINIGKFCHHL